MGNRSEKNTMIRILANKYEWDLLTLEADIFRDNSTAFRKAVNKVLGYDGIIVDFNNVKHIVAWFPNQIKSINNKYPTISNNINENNQ